MATVVTVGTGSGGIATRKVVTLIEETDSARVQGIAVLTPNQESNANSPAADEAKALVTGDNTITIPSTAAGVVIEPPAGGTVALKLKGAAGDTGVVLSKKAVTKLAFDTTPPADFILNAGAAVTVVLYWY